MKRILSGLTALLLLLALCAGCGNTNSNNSDDDAPPQEDASQTGPSQTEGLISEKGVYYDITGIEAQETAMEYGGNTVPAEMYFYWLGYYCSYVEYQINMFSAYGMYTDLINEDGTIIWDGALDDTTPSQAAIDNTNSNVLSYLVLENMAKEYGVTLTDEDKADMESVLAQQIEEAGGEAVFQQSLTEMGISRETFDRISAAGYLLDHLEELASQPGSDLYEEPSREDNAYVDHILLMTIDSETQEPLSEEEAAAKRAQAEDLLAQLQAAEDVEALFNELVEEYGEDQGRITDSGYLVNPETNFVPEFLEATFALQPGEISGIVESDYGYHILLRKELTEDQIASLAASHLDSVLTERLESAVDEMTLSEKLDGVVVGEFYEKYMDILSQIQAASSSEDGGTDAAQ